MYNRLKMLCLINHSIFFPLQISKRYNMISMIHIHECQKINRVLWKKLTAGSHVESRALDDRKKAAVVGKMRLRKTPWRRDAHFWNVRLRISWVREFKRGSHHWSRHLLDVPINSGLKECVGSAWVMKVLSCGLWRFILKSAWIQNGPH